MIDIDFQVDTMNASLFIRGVNLKAVPIAEQRALNKVIVTVRKEAVPLIHNVRRLKKSVIRQQLEIVRATRQHLEARVRASKKPIPLKEFAAKWSGRQGNRRVVVNVSGTRKMLQHAFIVTGIGGHVFERTSPARLPIRKLFGPSLGSAIVAPAINVALRRVVAGRWPAVYTRELNFALSKLRR